MRVFVAVADGRSFAEAARRLRLSPAAATRAVAALEDRLGLTLLHRTTRSVTLTERGADYLAACRQVLDEIEAAERRVRGEQATPRGLLTVSAPVLFGRLHVLPVVTALLQAHPDLRVRLSLSDRFVHLVEEGVDVVVRIGALVDSALTALRVGTVRRVVVASPGYLAACGAPATPAELGAHEIIAFDGLEATDEWRFGGPDGMSVRVTPRLVVNTAAAAIAAAEAGAGITRALSYQVAAGLAAGRLVELLASQAPPSVPVQLLYPARRFGAANVAAFTAAARPALGAALAGA